MQDPLDVAKSISNKKWIARDFDERLALTLTQRHALSDLAAQILAARDVPLEEAASYLNPTLKSLLPDPLTFKGMSEAVARLKDAILLGEKICVFGDYDVDGATSSALIRRYFSMLSHPVEAYIPDRLEEGYGPNVAAFSSLKEQGMDVVVCVDCGTTSFEPLAHGAKIGLDVIVVDHHEPESRLPDSVAVINPKRLDETGAYTYLAAVGVTFMVLVGLNRALREADYFKEKPEPNLMALLDLVALGTVCDVVPLVGVNRAFVTQGLKVMAGRGNSGLAALCDVAGVKEAPEAYHAGYVLGPRVNAGGRVGESSLGSDLLSLDHPLKAREIAAALNGYNQDRQELEQQVLDEAITQVEAHQQDHLVIATGKDWHPGVIGIVASRLKDRYNLPACVISLHEGKGHGSGRSISGVDLGQVVIAARQGGFLEKGGGHAMAAGFSVQPDQIEALSTFMRDRIGAQIQAEDIRPTYKYDAIISPLGVTPALVEELDRLGPYGAGNPQPRFVLSHIKITRADVVGRDHVRCFLSDDQGIKLKAIAFRALDTDLGQLLLNAGAQKLHIAGRLKLDTWGGGHSVQVLIDDASRAS